jgi:putative transposase
MRYGGLTERAGIEKEFKRRIKTQTVLPSAETAAMLFWSLLASGQITMRKVDGWQR